MSCHSHLPLYPPPSPSPVPVLSSPLRSRPVSVARVPIRPYTHARSLFSLFLCPSPLTCYAEIDHFTYRLGFLHIRRTFCSRRARSLFLLFSSLGVRIGVFGLCFFFLLNSMDASRSFWYLWSSGWRGYRNGVSSVGCAVNDALGRSAVPIPTFLSSPHSGRR